MRQALVELFPHVKRVLFFSLFTNILILAPSLYMLEVYDRVVNTRNHTTLLMLTLFVVGAYLFLEVLEWVRRQMLYEASVSLDRQMRNRVFHAIFAARLQNVPGAGIQYLKDFRTIRDFLPSPAFLSFLDAPFALLVLVLIFSMNPMLGWFAVGGALAQFGIGFFNERRTREPFELANRHAMASQAYAQNVLRNAQVIESMGMLEQVRQRWISHQRDFLYNQALASDHAGTNAALSKMVQSLMGSLLLGFGCYLSLQGLLSASLMIVGSILGGRVLAPLVQIIGNWRNVEQAREAFIRLDSVLQAFPVPEASMPLPAPSGLLSVENVIAGPPLSQLRVIKGISFVVRPGGSLAIVGPSASGKTTLARLLVGIWPAMSGKVRLDGNDMYMWNKDELGRSIGYLPQNVELFDGTIADNIARFGAPDKEKLEHACRMVGLDGLIAGLPNGFATPVGDEGMFLSGGERQRVALARAVYGMPKFVVLDEPNSSLDASGDAALMHAIRQLKAAGSTVIVITHRQNILSVIDHMMVLVDGQIQKSGPRDEVLAALQPKPASPAGISALQPAGGAA